MSPAVNVFAVPYATSSSFYEIVAASSVVGRFLLSARWPATLPDSLHDSMFSDENTLLSKDQNTDVGQLCFINPYLLTHLPGK